MIPSFLLTTDYWTYLIFYNRLLAGLLLDCCRLLQSHTFSAFALATPSPLSPVKVFEMTIYLWRPFFFPFLNTLTGCKHLFLAFALATPSPPCPSKGVWDDHLLVMSFLLSLHQHAYHFNRKKLEWNSPRNKILKACLTKCPPFPQYNVDPCKALTFLCFSPVSPHAL